MTSAADCRRGKDDVEDFYPSTVASAAGGCGCYNDRWFLTWLEQQRPRGFQGLTGSLECAVRKPFSGLTMKVGLGVLSP